MTSELKDKLTERLKNVPESAVEYIMCQTDTLVGVSELLWGLAESAEGSEITPNSLVILARLVEGVQGDLNALIDANRPRKATNRRKGESE